MKEKWLQKLKYYGIIILVLGVLALLSHISSEQQKKSLMEDGTFELQYYIERYEKRGYVKDITRESMNK